LTKGVPFNDVIAFLDKMFLKRFHFLFNEGRLKERDSGILKSVRGAAVKITS
jgi:hypothetical protein